MRIFLYFLIAILGSKVHADSLNLEQAYLNNFSREDQDLYHLKDQKDIVAQGEQIYQSVCFACHGKNLEGATGPNLRDGEWLHGFRPSEILNTIQKGFPDKGMVEFGKIYNPQQLKSITAYLLSKQQGLRNVEYQLYHDYEFEPVVEVSNDTKKFIKSPIPNLRNAKAEKEGKLLNNFLDVYIAEVMVYAVEFDAYLIAPEDAEYSFTFASRLMPCELYIDGKKEFTSYKEKMNYKIKKKIKLSEGFHKIKARYFKMGGTKSPRLFFTWSGPGFEDEPLSLDSKKSLKVTHVVDLQNQPKIYRGTMEGFPSSSLYLGYPNQINYVFGSRSCDILGIWKGDFLDIGGAISNRGDAPSEALGNWIFKNPEQVQLSIGQQALTKKFKGYELNHHSTLLKYQMIGQEDYRVEIQTSMNEQQQLNFSYRISPTPKEQVSLNLPQGLKVASQDGKVQNSILHINHSNASNFSFTLIHQK